MNFASMDFGEYTVKHNTQTNRFDIVKKGVGLIMSCKSPNNCMWVIKRLMGKKPEEQKEIIDQEILNEMNRLNQIKEPRPANRSSFLNDPLSKATKKIIKMLKDDENDDR